MMSWSGGGSLALDSACERITAIELCVKSLWMKRRTSA